MTVRDRNTLDLLQQKIRLAEDVMVWPVRERGELVYRIEIPKLHRFYRVGYEEYVFISLLDGKTTIPQACGLAAAKLGSRAPTASKARVIARWLLQHDLAHLDSDAPPTRQRSTQRSPRQQNSLGRLLARLNPFWMRVPIPGGDRLMNAGAKILGPLLSPTAVALGAVMIVVACIVLVATWTEFSSWTIELVHPRNWFWLLGTWVVLKIVHELAHAAACHRQGGTVRESGVVFILFAPMAYVDVSSCWRMNSRWSRIAVSAAGMYVELLIASIAVLLWMSTDSVETRFFLHNLVFAAGLSTLLFNANALMRFDGYFILADLIEVPNLYSEATNAVRRLAQRLVTGERAGGGSLVGWRRHFVLAYGAAAFFWRIAICISLAIAASTMFAGAGVAIAAAGIAMWIGRPAIQLVRYAADLRSRDPIRFLRSVTVATVSVCILIALIFWVPIPTSVRVPAVVRYLPETMVRSRTSGFVDNIHVRDGDFVRRGDLLVELDNRVLTSRLAQLKITSDQNEIRIRQAMESHDPSEQNVLRENQRAVHSQIEQLQRQTAGLRVMAPHDGRVIRRNLDSTLGTYVHEGDSILTVASETDKEIIAVVHQEFIEEVRPLVGSHIRARTAAFDLASGRLDRVEPRAEDHLFEPSLAATEGGALAVQAAPEDDTAASMVLLDPHFRGRIALADDVACRVPAGMRVEASLGYRTEPLASRLQSAIRRLWHAARNGASD